MNLARRIGLGACLLLPLGVSASRAAADAEHMGQQVDYMDAQSAFDSSAGCISTHVDVSVGDSYTHNTAGPPVSDASAYFNFLVTDRCTPGSIKRYGTTLSFPYAADLSKKLEGASVTFDQVAAGVECTQVGSRFTCVDRSFAIAITVDWEPAGDIVTNEGKSHDRAENYVGHSHFIYSERPAIARLIGSIDGEDVELTDTAARLSYSKFTASYVNL